MDFKQYFDTAVDKLEHGVKTYVAPFVAISCAAFVNAQFYRTGNKIEESNDSVKSQGKFISQTEIYDYAVKKGYMEEVRANVEKDAYNLFESKPENLNNAINVDHYKLIHLGLGESINFSDAYAQAAIEKKDSILVESDQVFTDENTYCILPTNKLLGIISHNLKSQQRLGIDGVPVKIYNTRLGGTGTQSIPLEIDVDPTTLVRSSAAVNSTLDHETAHVQQLLNDPGMHFTSVISFYGDLAAQLVGSGVKNPYEDKADVVRAKLDKNNVAGFLETFIFDAVDTCSTEKQLKIVLDKLYKEKPGTHSTTIQRAANIINVAENRGPQ